MVTDPDFYHTESAPAGLDTAGHVDVFNKVQDLLAFNQKAGAHKKAKVEYLLFSKLFCGKCGDMMVGICGTSKAGVTHHYYACRAQRKHQCKKRAVRQDWIETLVLKHLLRLVRNGPGPS